MSVRLRAAHFVATVFVRASLAKTGGADRDQTGDLVVANDALYQLSYCPRAERVVLGDVLLRVNTNFQVCTVPHVAIRKNPLAARLGLQFAVAEGANDVKTLRCLA